MCCSSFIFSSKPFKCLVIFLSKLIKPKPIYTDVELMDKLVKEKVKEMFMGLVKKVE